MNGYGKYDHPTIYFVSINLAHEMSLNRPSDSTIYINYHTKIINRYFCKEEGNI